MVVPTYPEGGSHALHRCASTTIRLCESATLCRVRVVRDWKNMVLATAPADSAESFTVGQRAARLSNSLTVKVAGGGTSVYACSVFPRRKGSSGDLYFSSDPEDC